MALSSEVDTGQRATIFPPPWLSAPRVTFARGQSFSFAATVCVLIHSVSLVFLYPFLLPQRCARGVVLQFSLQRCARSVASSMPSLKLFSLTFGVLRPAARCSGIVSTHLPHCVKCVTTRVCQQSCICFLLSARLASMSTFPRSR